MVDSGAAGDSRIAVIGAGLALVAGLLVLGLSIVGLAWPGTIYGNADVRAALRPNDAVNLIVVMPLLALALVLRAVLIGKLLLAAVGLTFVYNSLASLLSMDAGWQQTFHVLIMLIAGVSVVLIYWWSAAGQVRGLSDGRWTLRWPGIVLALFGLAFGARAMGLLAGGDSLPRTEFALSITDLVFALLWCAAGLAMWLKSPRGFWAAGAFLLQAGLLFIGLLVLLILQPVINDTALNPEDLIVSAVMAAFFAVPVVWFILTIGAAGSL